MNETESGVTVSALIKTPAIVALKPTHHPPDELLIDRAAGALSDAETLMIDLHIDVCAECRETVRAAEAVGGALLDTIAPVRLRSTLFAATISALDSNDRARPVVRTASTLDPGWPAPLRRHLAGRRAAKWRWFPAGFRAVRIPVGDENNRVWMMRAPGGRGPLRHSHVADEWTIVLQGGFTDETGKYEAGDFAYMGPGNGHTMIAEPGEGCLCVVMVRADPVYHSVLGRLLAPLIRL